MAKLYFRYGAMNSSKTANLAMVAYNYKKQGKHAVILKSNIDTRSQQGYIESRVGIKEKCIDIDINDNIFDIIENINNKKKVDCLLVDECHFLNKKQVRELVDIVDELNIPTICYGLKNSFISGEIFEGSVALLYYAESIEEIKTVCTFCDKKATMNLRIINNKPIYTGNVVTVGDTDANEKEYYVPVCRKHYIKPPIDIESFV